jgi:Ca-activated chloride channel family protein
MIRFAHPELLFLLLALPLLAWWAGRSGRVAAVRFPSAGLIRELGKARPRSARWGWWFRLPALALIVLGLARPQVGQSVAEVEASGIDIILAVDLSTSMEALDFKLRGREVNRLEVVKPVVARFIGDRPNDRIGLIAFAGRPYVVSPPTLDHDWLLKRLDQLHIGLIEDGTAIGSALAAAANRLKDQEAKSKLIILLTDGVNNAGKIQPEAAAEAAAAHGIRVYTIGAGTKGMAPMPARDMFGNRVLVRQQVDIDEESLTRVAEMTGGKYFRATDTDSLESIYREINQLETTKRTIRKFESYRDLFAWAVVPALVLLILEGIWTDAVRRRLP